MLNRLGRPKVTFDRSVIFFYTALLALVAFFLDKGVLP